MITLTPLKTEKSYTLVNDANVYMFEAPLTANRHQIAESVTEEFKVTVEGVKTMVRKGKAIRFSRGKKNYPGTTHRSDKKIAFVTLKKGDSIKVFEDEEASEEKK